MVGSEGGARAGDRGEAGVTRTKEPRDRTLGGRERASRDSASAPAGVARPPSWRRLVRKVCAFLAVNAILLASLLLLGNKVGEAQQRASADDTSVVERIGTDRRYDYLILGPSHAYSFLWGGNQEYTEAALGGSVMNIGVNAAGPYVEDVYLKYFLSKGNSADVAIYFAHPFSFFAAKWNDDNRFVGREPLDEELFRILRDQGLNTEMLFFYAQSKLNPLWLLGEREVVDVTARVRTGDSERAASAHQTLYTNGVDPAALERYWPDFEASVERLRQAGTRVLIVVPPTLIEPEGLDLVLPRYERLAAEDGVALLDLSSVDLGGDYYQDYAHLNRSGVVRLLEEYVGPAVASLRTEPVVGSS